MNSTVPLGLRLAASFCIAMLACHTVGEARQKELARVFVYAKAAEGYEESRKSDEGLLPQSYHIMRGLHFGGNTKDASLEDTDFQTLADTLKMELVKQEYYPARKFEDGDLLIVIHWGTTVPPEDLEEDFGSDAAADVGVDQTFDESSALNPRRINEAVLGFDQAFKEGGLSLVEEKILLSQYHTERYFFILMAYDWQLKRQTGETKLLWTTKFSLESIGTNFVDSFPALFRGAREFYGVDLKGIASQKTNFGSGEVTMGELQVIESARDEKEID
ncbi:hypothetical protein [Pelagicoccus sp. SDUM812005]|uniref:hypothetical protein n=1 Tax=Pelagicoccus sp. SDUM812005 TaxID=3041257 RepID=UPI0028116679|nr:hypothetical protein [Pelagicoccus sp. SDUM812005]